MNMKAKTLPRPAAPTSGHSTSTPALSLDERLQRIEAMGKRVQTYIEFMCQVTSQNGASGESRERAVAAFYERMVVVETQLARLYDEFRLE